MEFLIAKYAIGIPQYSKLRLQKHEIKKVDRDRERDGEIKTQDYKMICKNLQTEEKRLVLADKETERWF